MMAGMMGGARGAALGLICALGLAASAGTASAQNTPAAPVAAPPAPSASALAAARDVVVSSGMARSFAPMVPDIMHQIEPSITRTHPELAADLAAVMTQLEPEFQKDGDHMIDIAAQIYARRMSEDELKQTAAFFHTPAGAKYVAVQPDMLDELVVSMQSWTQELTTIMYGRVRDEMSKKGHNLM